MIQELKTRLEMAEKKRTSLMKFKSLHKGFSFVFYYEDTEESKKWLKIAEDIQKQIDNYLEKEYSNNG